MKVQNGSFPPQRILVDDLSISLKLIFNDLSNEIFFILEKQLNHPVARYHILSNPLFISSSICESVTYLCMF